VVSVDQLPDRVVPNHAIFAPQTWSTRRSRFKGLTLTFLVIAVDVAASCWPVFVLHLSASGQKQTER